MLKLVEFLAKWGVRGLCISGGGEPSLHREIDTVIITAVNDMDVAFVTNGVRLSEKLLEALTVCRWVSFSVNAAKRNTYTEVMGADHFNSVIGNISALATLRRDYKSKVDICYKYLLLPENQHEIYDACRLAKSLGVQDFHVRPVDFEREDIEGHRKLELDKAVIEEQFAKCHEIENSSFHVYTVTHKFDADFHVKHDFDRCLATPLVLPILTDGNAYICVDKKMEAPYRIGSAYPNPEKILTWWGSEEHRKLIESVDISKCSRCTWSQYQRQISEVVENDRMCVSFP
jgi:MoaA/NifB/PqqE/SkfB family radical SAM enzyme